MLHMPAVRVTLMVPFITGPVVKVNPVACPRFLEMEVESVPKASWGRMKISIPSVDVKLPVTNEVVLSLKSSQNAVPPVVVAL